jgi:hypothetical protein
VSVARTRLAAAIANAPGAQTVQAEFDARRAQLDEDCRAREDRLLIAFRDALKNVTANG